MVDQLIYQHGKLLLLTASRVVFEFSPRCPQCEPECNTRVTRVCTPTAVFVDNNLHIHDCTRQNVLTVS